MFVFILSSSKKGGKKKICRVALINKCQPPDRCTETGHQSFTLLKKIVRKGYLVNRALKQLLKCIFIDSFFYFWLIRNILLTQIFNHVFSLLFVLNWKLSSLKFFHYLIKQRRRNGGKSPNVSSRTKKFKNQ